jgi:NADH-quinone oxidoreductase subunit N
MATNETITFLLTWISTYYIWIDTTLTDFYLYEFTLLILFSFNVYVCYLWIIDSNHHYNNLIADSFFKTFSEIYKSSSKKLDLGAYLIKTMTIVIFVVCTSFFFIYIITSEVLWLEALHTVNVVTFFYMFWTFFNIFLKNLKLLLEKEKNIPFIILVYFSKGNTYDFFWNKTSEIFKPFIKLLYNNLNSHYAFIWSFFFSINYTGWFQIETDYLIEAYLITFVLIMFSNLIYTILFSGSSIRRISIFFINQLFYIILGAFFLLYTCTKWYYLPCVKNVCLGGYYLLLSGTFYFKVWIIFFFLLCLLLANTYVRQSMNSLVELSILFSASVPILFIIIGLVDIFAIILSFEVLSLIIIGLCGLTMDKISTEASIKYFCQNSIITGLTFLGVFFYLFIFKNTNLLMTQVFIELLYETKLLTYFFKVLLFSSIILWLLSFMFKFGIFPVNFYVADIYNGSSAAVILFISAVIKPTVLFVFSTKVISLFNSQIIIVSLISCFCISSIILGDWMSFNTHNLKRFFGHSSVSQYGFLLLSVFSQSNDILFYAFVYSFIYNISTFIIFVIIIENRSFNLVDLSNLYFNDLNLYFKHNLSLKLLITVCFLSISGVPPFILFIFKYLLFVQIFSAENYVFLLLIFIFNTGISSAYYFRIINDIWFVNLSNSNFNSLSEKKSLTFRFRHLISNSYTYMYWVIIIISSYFIFVHFDSIYSFVTTSVFDDLSFKYND